MLFGFEVIDQNNNYSADRKNDGAACSLFFIMQTMVYIAANAMMLKWDPVRHLIYAVVGGLNPESGGGQAHRRRTSIEPGRLPFDRLRLNHLTLILWMFPVRLSSASYAA